MNGENELLDAECVNNVPMVDDILGIRSQGIYKKLVFLSIVPCELRIPINNNFSECWSFFGKADAT